MIAVIPYEAQAACWISGLRERYFRVLERSDGEILISLPYTPTCIRERNRYLVDRATHMIADYTGEPGGTRNTIAMARRKGLAITILNPNEIEKEPRLRSMERTAGKFYP